MKISLINQCKKIAKNALGESPRSKKWKNFFCKKWCKCIVGERETLFFEIKIFDFFDIGGPWVCFFSFFCFD
jgi:hypothetical protein